MKEFQLFNHNLSAAFDTVDHEKLIDDFENIGLISRNSKKLVQVLPFFKIILCVKCKEIKNRSASRKCAWTDLIHNTVYASELALVLKNHTVKYKCYANDTRIYLAVNNYQKI